MNTSGNKQANRRAFMHDSLQLVLASTIPSALLSGCTTAFAPADGHSASSIAIGDTWEYDELNGYNRERVAQLRLVAERGDPPVLRVEVEGKPLSKMRNGQHEEYVNAWVVKRDAAFDRDNRYDPPLPLLPEVLEPGASESWQSMVTHDAKERPWRWHAQIDAVGFERIEVAAGSFDTLRVRRMIKFEHPDFFRTLSERVDTLWFAPEVKRWVKREWHGEYQQKLSIRQPARRENWIVWELTRFTSG